MKQHITKEQWDELDVKIQNKLLNDYDPASGLLGKLNHKNYYKMGIGQILEFLGDDLRLIVNGNSAMGGNNKIKGLYQLITKDKDFFAKEIIDAGWKAVKEKLKWNLK